jgi:hypothetical protein
MLQYSAERVFRQTPNHQEEVYRMTKSVLILPSDEMDMALAEKDTLIAEQKNIIAAKEARIAELEQLFAASK